MLIAEHKHLAEHGAELVELRLDYIRRPVNLKRLLENSPCPIVATVRRPKDGGKWMRTEEERMVILRTAIANKVDYVDIEYDVAKDIPRYGPTKRIISYHNFDETPENLEDIHAEMSKLDPDIIKIATMANNPLDNVRALRLCRDSSIPTAAFCMGEMGTTSRILCGRFGSPLSYATFHSERQLAPGQLSWREMVEKFNYDNITSKTKILGVIADPVAHSLSPAVHNACICKLGLDIIYLPFRVPAEHLDEFIKVCPEMGIRGLSVTIPHKEKVLKSINALDDNVAGIRAANTVVFKDVNAYGYNTDIEAAISVLRETIEADPEEKKPFADKRILIMGAGGVARAIAYGLHRTGGIVFISARDFKKADDLSAEIGCKAIDWAARPNFECDIMINCTPVGMHPNMDSSPFEPEWFDKNTIVFDTVYNPERTLFVKYAREAECVTLTGVDMFVRQAARQFKLFTGKNADLEVMRYEVKRAISAANY
jgi:3-dehydroquinate dehydratase/shikimate dehydrogenase